MADDDDAEQIIAEFIAAVRRRPGRAPSEYGPRVAPSKPDYWQSPYEHSASKEQPVTIQDVVKKPRFDPTINTGQIIQVVTLVIMVGSGGLYMINEMSRLRRDMDDASKRAAIYVPIVDGLSRASALQEMAIKQANDSLAQANKVQDERIGNLADALREVRQNGTNTAAMLSEIRERLAVIQTKLQIERINKPVIP